MPHWTQTPEGRKKMSEAQKKYHRTAAGRAQVKKMISAKAKLTRPAAHLRVLADANGSLNGAPGKHKTGKQMVNVLAREGAIVRRERLLRELQSLDLFLEKTK